MSWPTPQDYSEAVQNPQTNFDDLQLKNGRLAVTSIGLPVVASGAFASVYRVTCDGNKHFAVRCFLKQVSSQHERYQRISEFVMNDTLPYTVDFNYLTRGILVHGQWYPLLKMDWVEGTTLDLFVRTNVLRRERLSKLAEEFKTMMKDLQDAGIAHGDLQHGNILITNEGELRLVDYDGMYVPGLDGMGSAEIGHRNYQHPDRDGAMYNAGIDNFSAWSIYISLAALSIDPTLATTLQACDECLLFRQGDYRYPLSSRAFATLEEHENEQIRSLSKTLRTILSKRPDEIPYLSETVEIKADLPRVTPEAGAPYAVPAPAKPRTTARPSEQEDPDFEFKEHWPALMDYMHAMTNPSRNFIDPSMQAYSLMRDHGAIRPQGTDHGAVFKFSRPRAKGMTPKADMAVKVFLKADQLIEHRYKTLHTFLHGGAVNYGELNKHFADFVYIPDGMRVGQKYYPVVRMKYVQGPTLFEAVERNRSDRAKMKDMIFAFVRMMALVESSGIIHGDIEPENIIVQEDDMVLVDYDLTTTPTSRSLTSRVLSNKHYRHPKLPRGEPAPNDNFSAWLMYYSLKIIAQYPAIWSIAGAKPGRLLFSADDLHKPHASHLFRLLRTHYSERVRGLAEDVEDLLKTPPDKIEPLRVKTRAIEVFDQLRADQTDVVPYGAPPIFSRRTKYELVGLGTVAMVAAVSTGTWLMVPLIFVFLVGMLAVLATTRKP
jgi:tRNA A-37 threonylcarbamoyl transferase component Bud32